MNPIAPENSLPRKPKLLERARDLLRANDYSRRTEEVRVIFLASRFHRRGRISGL